MISSLSNNSIAQTPEIQIPNAEILDSAHTDAKAISNDSLVKEALDKDSLQAELSISGKSDFRKNSKANNEAGLIKEQNSLSPFKAINAQSANSAQAPERKISDSTTFPTTPAEKMEKILSNLAKAELKQLEEGESLSCAIREGLMLSAYEENLNAQAEAGISEEDAQLVAMSLTEAATTGTSLDSAVKRISGLNCDVNALVQIALRDSYHMQNQELMDYATQVQLFNEQKKMIRERLSEVQEHRSLEIAEGNTEGFLTAPIEWRELNQNGEWHTPMMSAEEAQRWSDAAQVASGSSTNPYSDLESFFSDESSLTKSQKALLKDLAENSHGNWLSANGNNDDVIRENLDDLLPLLANLNQEETQKYLVPILKRLLGGVVTGDDKDAARSIFDALSPAQVLAIAEKTNFTSSFSSAMKDDFALRVEQALIGLKERLEQDGADETASATVSGRTPNVAMALISTISNIISATGNADASAFLGELEAYSGIQSEKHHAAENAQEVARSEMGAQAKSAQTFEQLESYIKSLEEDMNSIGDDAQLANITLQQSLHKQQHTLQMLTNLSKVMHDMAMAIARKTGN
ncbi:hypothetical protein KAI87_11260 [Myxococcota bacterium]|nr:hypothetical protein [Myxococcota bacterium]